MNPNWDPVALRRLVLAGTLSPRRCAVAACSSTTNLLRCGGCKVVCYCGPEHQAQHRRKHKAVCNKVKERRVKLDHAEAALRATPPNGFTLPADVFNAGAGKFWGILDTRDYMRARFGAVEALLQVDTLDAVEKALAHCYDMLRLCRSDNLGIRHIIPALLLRLNQEQQCYDFIKWWATIDDEDHYNGGYDWGNATLPYLDLHDADPFEPVDRIIDSYMNLSDAACLVLLKIRMYLDVSDYEKDEGFPPDPTIDRHIGEIVSARVSRHDSAQIEAVSHELKEQIEKLCLAIHKMNPHFWELLINDSEPSPPSYYSRCTPEEAALACIQCKRAWTESEDALLLVESEISKYTPVYTPKAVSSPICISQATTTREKRHARGSSFPSSRSACASPDQLFSVKSHGPSSPPRFVSVFDDKQALVFVDGACANDEQANPSGGWAVIRGPSGGDASVISGRLEDRGPFGTTVVPTSNRAELRAAIAAMRDCDWLGEGFRSIVIATDSEYVVQGATQWAKQWLNNGWKLQSGEEVKNQDLWDMLLGEIEHLKTRGLVVEFWRIRRELNTEADAAAKAASTQYQPVVEFRDHIPATTGPPTVLALLLESEQLFNDIHANLISSIATKTMFERASTPETALAWLQRAPISTVILIGDGAITRQQAVREAVMDRLHAGATVVLAGQFSNTVNEGQCNRFMKSLNLEWKRGSYERSMVKMRSCAVGDPNLCKELPRAYSAKALYLANVPHSQVWYAHEYDDSQAAVAFTRIGQGRLGYLGDVNGEIHSSQVVLAMCGLL